MLDFKKDRLDYGTLLMPPEKHELTHAVATTYSLDLYTLLAIPVALFYSKVLDGSFEENRSEVLESIQNTADILNIYCQKGKIKVPRKFNWLFAYIEDSIHEITPPNYVSSFHPKIWLLRFKKAQEIKYRVIVLSRNLTFDRSWDLAFHADGSLTKRSYPSNKPLLDFIKHLFEKRRVKGANTLVNELAKVKFENIDGFKSLTFHPIGIDGYQTYKNPLDQRDFDKLLILTPFLDRTTLKKLHQNCPENKVILSREEELQKIPAAVFHGYEPYFLSRRIVDGEAFEDLDETGSEAQRQQLHAKLFIGERQRRNFWFLGSANCTDPAFTRNTEFMVELEGENDRSSPEHIRNILIDPDDDTSIFEPYEPADSPVDEESESARQLIRKLEYDLINANFNGKVIPRDKTQNFDLSLIVDMKKKAWGGDIVVKIAPLNFDTSHCTILPDFRNELFFENLSEVELSKFVVISIHFKTEIATSFVIKMQIELPGTRKDKILKSLITSRENFFKYMNFLLSDNPYLENTALDSHGGLGNGPPTDTFKSSSLDLPIFENLLMTASRNPDKLKSIERLVQRLTDADADDPDKIIPDDFYEFWSVFKQVAGIK